MPTASVIHSSTVTELASKAALPMEYSLALNTWFAKNTLQQALANLHKGKARHFLFFRHSAGLLFENDISATIKIVEGKGKHKYVFRDGWCSQCIAGKTGHRCHHIAALALLCIRRNGTALKPVTIPFESDPWQTIGRYLCERLTIGNKEITWKDNPDSTVLSVQQESGLSLQVLLHESVAAELQALGITDEDASRQRGGDLLQPLVEYLIEAGATENERALLNRGSSSKQLHRDRSGWMWLARFLFLNIPAGELHLLRQESGQFLIQSSEQIPRFQLLLPRHHTWELLGHLDLERYGFNTLPPAEQFNRVHFNEAGDALHLEKWCRLASGAEYKLAEQEENRYGSRYCLQNSFFGLASIPAGERIHNAPEQPLSLFDLETRNETKCANITIPSNEIPKFLERNHKALQPGRHQVAQEILELHVANEPDALQLTDYSEDREWCYLAGFYRIGNQRIDLAQLLSAVSRKQKYIPGRHWLDLHNSPLRWFHSLGKERLTANGMVKLTRQELLLLGSQVHPHNDTLQSTPPGPTLSFLLGEEDESELPSLGNKQKRHLRGYQVGGVNWLARLQHYGLGGILADDMGLGKTHQALGLIDLMTNERDRVLIVCPAAVLYHWPEKQQAFFPHLGMEVHHGIQRNLAQSGEGRIIVTTYGILRQDIDELALLEFRMVIFDEMHTLKNNNTSTFKAARRLQAETMFGLTGTPVENNIQELENLLTICLPDLFSVRAVHQLFKKAESPEQRKRVQGIAAPFILRRTRGQVLKELPECTQDIRLCELSPDQVAAYRQAVEQVKGVTRGILEGEPLADFTHILTTITRLKQICNHLCQLEGSTDWKLYRSGKWDEFIRLVEQCLQTNLKVVVFSQFTTMLDIMEAWLRKEKIDHISLRGEVGAKERNVRTRHFNSEKQCKICCASLLAGGTGIDLTGAQVVIHYDRWWNPAKEEQATARVHRMGQHHPVQVYKLVTVGTLEEKIHHLIETKRTLAAELISEDDGSILKTLNREELADLFDFAI